MCFPHPKQCTFLLKCSADLISPPMPFKRLITNQYLVPFVFYYIINTVHRKMNEGSECVNCSAIYWLVVLLYLQQTLTRNLACRPPASDRFSPHSLFFLGSESRFWLLQSPLSWDRASEVREPLALLIPLLELSCLQDAVLMQHCWQPREISGWLNLTWSCCPCA